MIKKLLWIVIGIGMLAPVMALMPGTGQAMVPETGPEMPPRARMMVPATVPLTIRPIG